MLPFLTSDLEKKLIEKHNETRPTLRRPNIPEAFLKASDFPNSSSFSRVPSRWLLAHSPIPMATPCKPIIACYYHYS